MFDAGELLTYIGSIFCAAATIIAVVISIKNSQREQTRNLASPYCIELMDLLSRYSFDKIEQFDDTEEKREIVYSLSNKISSAQIKLAFYIPSKKIELFNSNTHSKIHTLQQKLEELYEFLTNNVSINSTNANFSNYQAEYG